MKEKTTFHKRLDEISDELHELCSSKENSFVLMGTDKNPNGCYTLIINASTRDIVDMLKLAIDISPQFKLAFKIMLDPAGVAFNGTERETNIIKLKKEQ
jgi:hypothetical protein